MPRWLSSVLLVLVLLSIGIAIAAPIGPMPGFRLGGSPAPAPAQWSAVTLPDEVLLATPGGLLPHVVIIWIVEFDERLYVVGAPDSNWVVRATHSPDVRLRIGDDVYDMRATRVQSPRPDILKEYVDRYDDDYPDIIERFPPVEEFAKNAALFELASR